MHSLTFLVFTAALMLCGHMLCARHSGREDDVANGRALLAKAADALDMLDAGNHRISQCARYIRYLCRDGTGEADAFDVDLGSFLTTELFDMAVLDLLPRDQF